MLIKLQGVNSLFDLSNGDTFPIIDFPNHHRIEEPKNIELITTPEWYDSLNEQDTAILMAYYYIKYENKRA